MRQLHSNQIRHQELRPERTLGREPVSMQSAHEGRNHDARVALATLSGGEAARTVERLRKCSRTLQRRRPSPTDSNARRL
jgi:hypothetical protein